MEEELEVLHPHLEPALLPVGRAEGAARERRLPLLQLEDALLPVSLLLLNILHEVVEYGLGLQLRLLGGTRLRLLDIENLAFVS